MFKEATHNSATLTLPFQESWASISSLKSEIYQKKRKRTLVNVLTYKEATLPSQLPSGRQF